MEKPAKEKDAMLGASQLVNGRLAFLDFAPASAKPCDFFSAGSATHTRALRTPELPQASRRGGTARPLRVQQPDW